ncbi:MAG TPA: SHOCT domain-containing protein [Sphingobacteriaceae bacterium]
MIHGYNEEMGWGMWFIPIIILFLIFLLIKNDSQSNRPVRETPMEILKRRYAKGEITREQFEEMKKDIL